MKKTIKRSGFTIVELVIVIAVIAVLAGVLIPTFGGIIERANESNDTQVVATINKLLVVDNIIKGDDPNDAVEIKKMLKENGVDLKTKSEGKYIWYDIDQNKVILAGLNENGIVFLNENDKDPNASETKGTFKGATAPELFIDGYVFLSDESDDGLAEAICGLRNPKGEGKDNAAIVEAMEVDIDNSLEKIKKENENLHTQLSALMNKTAVMTEAGVVFWGSDSKDVTKIIISSEMKNVTESSVSGIKSTYPNIIVVDFHSGIINIDNPEAVNSTGIYFVYNNDEIYAIDHKDGGDYAYLITKDERGKFIKKVDLIYVDEGGHQIGTGNANVEFLDYTFTHDFPYLADYPTKKDNVEKYYAFKYYSLYKNDTEGMQRFTSDKEIEYKLSEDQKLFVDGGGNLIIYAIFEEANRDFQIGESKYSSRYMTYMLANDKLPSGTTTITVISKSAKLDASLIGKESAELTLPSNVTLFIPRKAGVTYSDNFKPELVYTAGTENYTKYGTFKKDEDDGYSMLTIEEDVILNSFGNIVIDAILYGCNNTYFGFTTNDIGILQLESGAKINIKNQAFFKAYGVVRGNGEIVAENGSNVVEPMTILDLNGGTTTIASINNNASPFNRFKAENIRSDLTIEKGAGYSIYGFVNVLSANWPVTLKIAGVSGSDAKNNPLFEIIEGKITKKWQDDGIELSIDGEVNDCKKLVSVSVYDIDFTKVPLPLGDFDIIIKEDAKVTLSNSIYKVLPGSEWIVEKNAILTVDTKMVVYDKFVLNESCTGKNDFASARRYEGKFEAPSANFQMDGKLVLTEGAQFAGIIKSTSEDAIIEINSENNVKISEEIKEVGHAWKSGFLNLGQTACLHNVIGMNWNARWQTDVGIYSNISETEDYIGTFKYNGFKWIEQQ